MTEPAPRKRRARGSIDPEQILDGAFEVASREGLDGLSMPGLAAHLDVGVTSIYWYFRNKEDLLRQMSGRAHSRLQERVPSPDDYAPADWRAFLEDSLNFQRAATTDDDLIVDLVYMRTNSYTRATTRLVYLGLENVLAYLVRAGFSLRTAWFVYSTASVYTRGFLVAERVRRQNQTPPEGRLQLNLLDVEATPLLAELVNTEPIIIDNTGDASFEFGIKLILDQAEEILSAELQKSDAPQEHDTE